MKASSFINTHGLRTDDSVTVKLILLFLGGIVSAATSAPIEIGQILSEQKLEAQGQYANHARGTCGSSEVTLPAGSEYETFTAQYGNADVSYPCLLDEDFRVVASDDDDDDDDDDSSETLQATITVTSAASAIHCIRPRADSRSGLRESCAFALAGPARAPPGVAIAFHEYDPAFHEYDPARDEYFVREGALSSLARVVLPRHHRSAAFSRTADPKEALIAWTQARLILRLSLFSSRHSNSNGRWHEEVGLFRFCGSGKPQSLQRVCAANSTTKTTNNERRYR